LAGWCRRRGAARLLPIPIRSLVAMNERLAVVHDMTYLQARKIVQAYGKTVTEYSGVIADETKLPFPKAVIKQALLMVMPFAPSSDVRNALQSSYMFLADFQPGVGDEAIRPVPAHRQALLDPEEVAAVAKDLERWLPWLKRSTAEMQQLLQELRDAGFRD
jgi:hypothetical protein